MKKTILTLAAVLGLFVSAPAAELVLSTSTATGGVTKTVTVGRIQADPAPDGTIVLTVIPREVVKLADGTVLSDKFTTDWFTVTLDSTTTASLNTAIATAKQAADAAKAAAAATTPPAP